MENIDYKKLIKYFQCHIDNFSGFSQDLGIKILEYKDGKFYGEVPLKKEYHNSGGSAHGGFLCTVVDVMGAAVCCEAMAKYNNPDTKGATLSCNVNFLHRLVSEKIRCESYAIKEGRHIVTCQVNLYDGDSEEVALDAVVTYYFT